MRDLDECSRGCESFGKGTTTTVDTRHETGCTRPLLSLWKPTHAESSLSTRGRALYSTLTQLKWLFDGEWYKEMLRPPDNIRDLVPLLLHSHGRPSTSSVPMY
jgi:hypothetical protein